MLPLFIVASVPPSGYLEIVGDEAQHAISSLRIKKDEQIHLTDGAGSRGLATISEVGKKSLRVEIIEFTQEAKNDIELIVVQALTKGDRAKETIELLTQAGVSKIIPWAAQRSVGQWKTDTGDKWKMWAKEATKQSRRIWLPEILEIHSTEKVCDQIKSAGLSLVFEESASQKLSAVLEKAMKDSSPTSVLIVIGPEGGISEQEAESFLESGAQSVLMGRPIFRSAHAGIAALAAIQTGLKIW